MFGNLLFLLTKYGLEMVMEIAVNYENICKMIVWTIVMQQYLTEHFFYKLPTMRSMVKRKTHVLVDLHFVVKE